jgi:hypothetical protein
MFFSSLYEIGTNRLCQVPGKVSSYIQAPTDEELLLAPAYVQGFSLIDKRWREHNLICISMYSGCLL